MSSRERGWWPGQGMAWGWIKETSLRDIQEVERTRLGTDFHIIGADKPSETSAGYS